MHLLKINGYTEKFKTIVLQATIKLCIRLANTKESRSVVITVLSHINDNDDVDTQYTEID